MEEKIPMPPPIGIFEGCFRLLVVLVEDACADATAIYMGESITSVEPDRIRKLREEARTWIFTVSHEAFGFDWCCWYLGIDPQAMRARVREGQRLSFEIRNWHRRKNRPRPAEESIDDFHSEVTDLTGLRRRKRLEDRSGMAVYDLGRGIPDISDSRRQTKQRVAEVFVTKKSFYDPVEVWCDRLNAELSAAIDRERAPGKVRELKDMKPDERIRIAVRLGAMPMC